MKVLLYSFDTSKSKTLLDGENAYFIHKLKEDLKILSEQVLNDKPDLILGIAAFRRSQIECFALNQFNKFKVSKNNKKHIYNLETETFQKFFSNLNKKPYTTFCNWSSYKISEFVEDNKLNTKIAFIHVNLKDKEILKRMVKELRGSD